MGKNINGVKSIFSSLYCVAGDSTSIRRLWERVGRGVLSCRWDIVAFDDFILYSG